MSEMANTHEGDLWVSKFDGEIDYYWALGTAEHVVATMLKEFLLSNGDTTAAGVALEIDSLYDEYLKLDPLTRYEDDKGMESYIWGVYDVLFTLA
jgi:hypothetical protein